MTSGGSIIAHAMEEEIGAIKALVDAHKQELGFVTRPALLESIRRGELLVCRETQGTIAGIVHFRLRKDDQVTLYNLVVLPSHRRNGIAHRLVDALSDLAKEHRKQFIVLRCPELLSANSFYQHYGFKLATQEEGKHRRLNVWQLNIDNRCE